MTPLAPGTQVLPGPRPPGRGFLDPGLAYLLASLSRSLGGRWVFPLRDSQPAEISREAFLKLVDRHRLAPILAQQAPGPSDEMVPPSDLLPEGTPEAIRSRAERNRYRALKLLSLTLQVTEILGEGGVENLPLKGPLLALRIHGDLSRRHAGDMDLLVLPEAVPEADRILRQEGFRRVSPGVTLTRRQTRTIRNYGNHYVYVLPEDRVSLELHWSLFPRTDWMDESPADLWRRGVDQEVGGRRVRVLSPEDELRFLCVHGAKHAWCRLFWLYDSASWISNGRPGGHEDPLTILSSLPERQVAAQTLLLCRDLLGLAVPEAPQLSRFEARTVDFLTRTAVRTISRPWPAPYPQRLRLLMTYRSRLTRGISSWSQTLRRLLFCPADWEIVRLPDRFFFLYFFLRPFLWFYRRLVSPRALDGTGVKPSNSRRQP
mgnify:CR=1 FL=1